MEAGVVAEAEVGGRGVGAGLWCEGLGVAILDEGWSRPQ